MKKGNKTLLMLIALLVIVGGAIILLPDGESTSKETLSVEETTLVNVDDSMPNFTLEMTNGEKITPESLRGKVVLVNFWATWCPPCREELKRVQSDIVDRFASRGLVFLPISRGEDRAVVEKFLADNGYTFPAGLDTDESIYKQFASDYIPRNFLINRQGVVVETSVGYDPAEFDQLLKLIDMTLMAR